MKLLAIRTQLLIATVLIIFGLTGAILLILRQTVGSEVQKQMRDGTQESVRVFQSVQSQRELQLSRSAAMLAELPILKATMTTEHALTIQDASEPFYKLSGGDLFVLAKPDRKVVALHATLPNWSVAAAQKGLLRSLDLAEGASWWYDEGRLYWVFLRPITSGSGNSEQTLGVLVIGYQVDASVAQQLAASTGNQIALATNNAVIATTLPSADAAELQQLLQTNSVNTNPESHQIALHTDRYAYSSVVLHDDPSSPVRCFVLMPLAPLNSFLHRLNVTIFIVGAAAVIIAGVLFGFVARTITRPLDNLVSGVRALAAGDYNYSITHTGSREVAELSVAFAQMRGQLLASQQQRIESERISALARAASSISHDLRHYLAAVVANAEFLYEADDLGMNKSEIYEEIKTASNQMTDLIDSLRELSYQRSAISPVPANLTQVARRAIEAIQAKPEFRHIHVQLLAEDDLDGVFDPRKLERVVFNLLLNACEAVNGAEPYIAIEIRPTQGSFEIRVRDNGSGVPAAIRETLFDPFVSFGKPNGTGLGLAIVSKIVQDHAGSVRIESSTHSGTVILVQIPRPVSPVTSSPSTSIA